MPETMNTYCRRCGAYTETKFVNYPEAQELECRCAVCGKFKDYYSYAAAPDPELDAKVRINRVLKVIMAAAFIAFAVTMAVTVFHGTHHETAALITLVVSLISAFGCAAMIDEKADEKAKVYEHNR